ncbi:MAG: hypothetical protein E7271_06470 [Lachnospiraceae bacterium]|nr:hypothetical protein [Lachnospiraceae bacterium]
MYSDILDKVFSSKEVGEYLINGGLENSVDYIEELIFCSPISIKDKLEMLMQVEDDVRKDEENLTHSSEDGTITEHDRWRHRYRIERYDGFLSALKLALEQQVKEGVFVVESGDYDSDVCDIDTSFESIFATYDEAIDWIHQDITIDEYTPDDTHWYEVSAWTKNDVGKYEQICSYIIINGEVCFAWIADEYARKNNIQYYHSEYEINVGVPFVAGDIIEVNAVPFCPKYKALVTSIGDNRDCCCIQVMTCDASGVWKNGALKHNFVATHTYPFISPLYTASRYCGELEPDEIILKQLQSYINGSEERGDKLNDYLFCKDRTTAELKEFIKEQEDV